MRLAGATGATVRPLPESLGGVTVDLVDPSGFPCGSSRAPISFDALPFKTRTCSTSAQHEVPGLTPPSALPGFPLRVQRLGHIVVQTPKYIEALNWYLEHLGMIVSDFCFYPGQRERGTV